ncbi:DUF2087 domain-containing protein [Lactiplantibacillus paraplantarum]|uniref:DUF2087 domain-containing protein n=1 Tax=Lactiplantibacillus paraplantarum TaxID=60520 RepID=UPI0023AAE49F|nr:DUF2087 domain-containing protein [Lactiplantibacillus paraplantarum]WEE37411.1 DUF2087 domain-containing protein [Lactiplantibacillus paraplantarum]
MDLTNLTVNDLMRGWHQTTTTLNCNYCDANWAITTPVTTVEQHLTIAHGGNRSQLIHLDSRYNTLTTKQQDLLTAFATGIKDADLAKEFQLAAATIRHQKFTFREKAKQAKLYLAIYQLVFETGQTADDLIALPEQPGIFDDRFAITEDEVTQTLKQYFDFTHEPLQLKRWPKKQKAIVTILTRVIDEIPADQPFNETELNNYLRPIYFDYTTLRRYLIDYGFLKRTVDGRQYWRTATRED